jgi:predicted RNase H-like HicB family nuclease
MFATYTAKYTKITTGYMGQLVEWPEIVTEGRDIEDCRDMLRDALNEMILAYQHQGKEIPLGKRRFPLKGMETSIGLQRRNCASKLNCGQNIKLGGKNNGNWLI